MGVRLLPPHTPTPLEAQCAPGTTLDKGIQGFRCSNLTRLCVASAMHRTSRDPVQPSSTRLRVRLTHCYPPAPPKATCDCQNPDAIGDAFFPAAFLTTLQAAHGLWRLLESLCFWHGVPLA